MTTKEVREKYLKFFEGKDHKIISPAPLVLENDPTTLFTSSGMQPLVPYLMGKPHPEGKRVTDSQPAIRLQDINEVGDNRHTTFFEMLGNWSFGDYFKEEQLPWIWEFLTEVLNLPKEKLYVTIFEGNKNVPKDNESREIWKSLGLPDDHIFEYDDKKNWWSRSGPPDSMPVGEIGGPTSEIFYMFDTVEHKPEFGSKCHPNCDCGRFLEIGNSVFMVYKKTKTGLKELPSKNVDFGGGLERLVAATENKSDIFEIDTLKPIIQNIEKITNKKYQDNKEAMQIIADHLRAASFILSNGVTPGNKQQGYVARRLIRRAVFTLRKLDFDIKSGAISTFIIPLKDIDERIQNNWYPIKDSLNVEAVKFAKTLNKGLVKIGQIFQNREDINGEQAYDLYTTYGFPIELQIEEASNRGKSVDIEGFNKEMKKHQEKSRKGSAKKFKGGLADHSEEVTRLHTATHLLHAALRKVLGSHVEQKGSNITKDRLRFDFTHPEKLTDEQIKKVEKLVNEQIDKDLEVTMETMTLEEAKNKGALAFFGDKYDEKVNVYSIGEFSKEVCGGPHVKSTSELAGHVNITKETAASAGVRRIYAELS